MAIRIGTNNSTNYIFSLITDANYNYGLEDDRVVGLSGNDVLFTGAGNDYLEGATATTPMRMVTATTSTMAGAVATFCGSI
jgi:Ca2+-binding RTX toxin-like protein